MSRDFSLTPGPPAEIPLCSSLEPFCGLSYPLGAVLKPGWTYEAWGCHTDQMPPGEGSPYTRNIGDSVGHEANIRPFPIWSRSEAFFGVERGRPGSARRAPELVWWPAARRLDRQISKGRLFLFVIQLLFAYYRSCSLARGGVLPHS